MTTRRIRKRRIANASPNPEPEPPPGWQKLMRWLLRALLLGAITEIGRRLQAEAAAWTARGWLAVSAWLARSIVPWPSLALLAANIIAGLFLQRWLRQRACAPGLTRWALLAGVFYGVYIGNVLVNRTLALSGSWAAVADGTYAFMSASILDGIVRGADARRRAFTAWGTILLLAALAAFATRSWHVLSFAVSMIGAASVLALCWITPLPTTIRALILIYPLCLCLRSFVHFEGASPLFNAYHAAMLGKLLLIKTLDINALRTPPKREATGLDGGRGSARSRLDVSRATRPRFAALTRARTAAVTAASASASHEVVLAQRDSARYS